MTNNVITIAKFTIIEAARNKSLLFIIIGLGLLFGVAEFVAEIAITESNETSVLWLAFSARIFLVSLLCLFILTSLSREFDDKVMLHIFSHSIERHSYYLGKFLGFAFIAFISVMILCLLLTVYMPVKPIVFWSVSFYLELLILVALSLLFFLTFKQTVISFISIMAFYILARNMATIQLISESPILESNTLSYRFINWVLDMIHTILPSLYDFAQTSWLIYSQFNIHDLLINFIQCIIYVALISFAALFDLYRIEF